MDHGNTQASLLRRVDQPISQASGLPNGNYTSDSAFLNDRDTVIGRAWACIGFADQLPEKNYTLPIDFMQLPLLATRDANDTYRVFHNVCSHRGMTLVEKPCSNNGAMRCPYHSWTYANDGGLKATPNIGGYGKHTHEEFDPAQHGLKEIRSVVWLGAIFVNLSADAVEFENYIEPVIGQWSRFLDPQLLKNFVLSEQESKLSLTVESNWKLAVENFLESYHLPSVHPGLNRISPLNEHYDLERFENGAGQGSRNYKRKELQQLRMPAVETWNIDAEGHAEYPVLFPNTFLGIHADQLFIQYLQPLSPHRTAEHVRVFYYSQEACTEQYQNHRAETLSGWKSVFEEDIFAVERMQAGRSSPAYQGGVFSPVMDAATHHFHTWVARKLAP